MNSTRGWNLRNPAEILSQHWQLCIFTPVPGWLPRKIYFQDFVFTLLRERRGRIKALWLSLGWRIKGKKHLTGEGRSYCAAFLVKWKLLKGWKITEQLLHTNRFKLNIRDWGHRSQERQEGQGVTGSRCRSMPGSSAPHSSCRDDRRGLVQGKGPSNFVTLFRAQRRFFQSLIPFCGFCIYWSEILPTRSWTHFILFLLLIITNLLFCSEHLLQCCTAEHGAGPRNSGGRRTCLQILAQPLATRVTWLLICKFTCL